MFYSNMTGKYHLQCRVCRYLLAQDYHIIQTTSKIGVCDSSTMWYVREDNMPDWIMDALQKESWQKGRLLCPKCNGRLGSFSFIKTMTCQDCFQHSLPAVHILKNRVDQKFEKIPHEATMQTSTNVNISNLNQQEACMQNGRDLDQEKACDDEIKNKVTNRYGSCSTDSACISENLYLSHPDHRNVCIEGKHAQNNKTCDLPSDESLSHVMGDNDQVGNEITFKGDNSNSNVDSFVKFNFLAVNKGDISSANESERTYDTSFNSHGIQFTTVLGPSFNQCLNLNQAKPSNPNSEIQNNIHENESFHKMNEDFCEMTDFVGSISNQRTTEPILEDHNPNQSSDSYKVCHTLNTVKCFDDIHYKPCSLSELKVNFPLEANFCDSKNDNLGVFDLPKVAHKSASVGEAKENLGVFDLPKVGPKSASVEQAYDNLGVFDLPKGVPEFASEEQAYDNLGVFDLPKGASESASVEQAKENLSCVTPNLVEFDALDQVEPTHENQNILRLVENLFSNINIKRTFSDNENEQVVSKKAGQDNFTSDFENFLEHMVDRGPDILTSDLDSQLDMQNTGQNNLTSDLEHLPVDHLRGGMVEVDLDILISDPGSEVDVVDAGQGILTTGLQNLPGDVVDAGQGILTSELDLQVDNVDVDTSLTFDFLETMETSNKKGRKRRNKQTRRERKGKTTQKNLTEENEIGVVYEAWLVDYPEEHLCPVCFDLFCEPHRCVPCDHVLCEACLRRLGQGNVYNTPCPMCRQHIVDCVRNEQLRSTLKELYPDEYRARLRDQRKYLKDKFSPLPHRRTALQQTHEDIRNRILGQRYRSNLPRPRTKLVLTGFLLLVCFVPAVSLAKAVMTSAYGLVHDLMTWL